MSGRSRWPGGGERRMTLFARPPLPPTEAQGMVSARTGAILYPIDGLGPRYDAAAPHQGQQPESHGPGT